MTFPHWKLVTKNKNKSHSSYKILKAARCSRKHFPILTDFCTASQKIELATKKKNFEQRNCTSWPGQNVCTASQNMLTYALRVSKSFGVKDKIPKRFFWSINKIIRFYFFINVLVSLFYLSYINNLVNIMLALLFHNFVGFCSTDKTKLGRYKSFHNNTNTIWYRNNYLKVCIFDINTKQNNQFLVEFGYLQLIQNS